MMGRDFLPEEAQPGMNHVVILSNKLWNRAFGGDSQLVGKEIRMNGEQYTVVGILPPGIYDRFNSQLWVPLVPSTDPANRDLRSVLVMARLKPGVSIGQAQSEMNGITDQLRREGIGPNVNQGVSVESLHLDFVTDTTRRNLWLLLGAVGFLLLIACVNVANLLIARGTSRQRDLALKAALGASRSRLFSQLLTESLVLALLGGALGIFFAQVITVLMKSVMPPVGTMLPSEADIRISIPVVLFMTAVTVSSGLLFGSLPAWQATRIDLNKALKVGGRTGAAGVGRTSRRALVIAEFALALTLLAAGSLTLKSFWNLTSIDLGIKTDHLVSFRLPVPEGRLKTPEQMKSYYRQMLEKLGAVRGVNRAAAMTGTPASGPSIGVRFSLAGQPVANPADRSNASLQMVTPGYADTLGIQIVKGRSIDERDTDTSPRVAMVNENFVRRFLNGVDPLTQRILVDEVKPGAPPGKPIEWQIVGVFHNIRGAGSREEYPEVNVPFWQSPWPRVSMVVKTDVEPTAVIKDLSIAVNSIDPDMPLAGVRTLDEIVSESFAINRFSVVLFASFGILGLLLAAVGIYGVMAFGVGQRTHEFGVRIALGAQRSGVLGLVFKEATLLALIGGLIGLGGAYLVGRTMQSTLFGVSSIDVRAFGAVFLLLMISAWIACLFPALRASRVEPLVALKDD